MSNLKMVVSELQQQNRSLIDVREDIKSLLQARIDADKEKERSAGDAEEERRESKKQIRLSERSRPKSFGAGLAQGTGLAGLSDGIRGLLGPMLGSFAGALGGMSIGGLLGFGIGYLFRVAAGAILGKKYLQPLIDKMLPDIIQDFKLFGDGDDAMTVSELSSMVLGAAALIFGPKLIGRLISKGFGSLGRMIFPALSTAKDADFIGKDEKESIKKKVKGRSRFLGRGLIRNLGLAGIIGFIGGEVGTAITGLTGSEVLGNTLAESAEFAAMGAMFFGPAGAITLALGYLAVSAVGGLANWLKTKGDKFQGAMVAELEKNNAAVDAALEAGDIALAAAEAKKALTKQRNLDILKDSGRFVAEDDAAMQNYLLNRQLTAKLAAEAAIAAGDTSLGGAAADLAADIAGDTGVSDREAVMKLIEQEAALKNIPLIDAAQSFVVGEASSGIVSNDTTNMAAQIFGELLAQKQYAETRLAAPSTPVQRGGNVDQIKVPGGTYTPGIQWEKIKSVPGFGVADMFGSGNIFNNGPQPQASASPVNIGDYSTKVSNFAAKNTFVSQPAPVSIDTLKAYLGED
ncbi:hypothetical protein OAL25_00875 [bacterium]|nr:hypothetical protein [bacterium]